MEIICCRVGVDGNASHILPVTTQITGLICVVPAHIVRSIVVAVCVLHRPLRKSVLRQEPVQGGRHIRKLGVIVTVVCTVCSDGPHLLVGELALSKDLHGIGICRGPEIAAGRVEYVLDPVDRFPDRMGDKKQQVSADGKYQPDDHDDQNAGKRLLPPALGVYTIHDVLRGLAAVSSTLAGVCLTAVLFKLALHMFERIPLSRHPVSHILEWIRYFLLPICLFLSALCAGRCPISFKYARVRICTGRAASRVFASAIMVQAV